MIVSSVAGGTGAGTFIQVAVCFVGYFGGTLFGTAKREMEGKAALFEELKG